MKIVIMTFKDAPKERLDNALKLAKELNGEVYIGTKKYIDNIYNVLKANVNKDDLLLLEDDVFVCKDFIKKVENAISEFPDRVINFFNLFYNIDKSCYMDSTQWSECQCYFMPKRVINHLVLLYKAFTKLAPKAYKCNIADNFFKYCLKEDYVLYYPSLVQQFELKSTIFKNRTDEKSNTFIDEIKNS